MERERARMKERGSQRQSCLCETEWGCRRDFMMHIPQNQNVNAARRWEENILCLNVISCNKVTWVSAVDLAWWWIQAFIYLFLPPCLLSRNYSFLPSSISPSTFPSLPAPSLPLFLSLSRSSSTSPLPSVWSMASFPAGLSARIRLQSVQLSRNSMDLVKKKGVRKERTRNCLPFTDFRSCCSKSEVNTSQENKEVCVSLSLYIYTRVCVCVCVKAQHHYVKYFTM